MSVFRLGSLAWLAFGVMRSLASTNGAAISSPGGPAVAISAGESFQSNILPVLTQYCFACHGNGKAKGEVALDKYSDEARGFQDGAVWLKVWRQLRANTMPPKGRPQPTSAERALVIHWVERTLVKGHGDHPDPGQVTLRRLNRVEYANTIRDLLGVNFDTSNNFPADDIGYGFDTIGDVLSVSPLLLEKYLAAADKIIETATKSEDLVLTTRPPRIDIYQPNPGGELDCAREILRPFAQRAYRRPVTFYETDRLINLVEAALKAGDTFTEAIKVGLKAILISPHFLFREEPQTEVTGLSGTRPITEYALASRLSYFLWSSMPDEALMAEAEHGHLRDNLEAQVRRMLRDRKAKALTDNFAGQWLQLRKLKSLAPDARLFPQFDPGLRAAMEIETELLFDYIRKEDRSVMEFIDPDYTFLNERLARHYGLKGIKGDNFQLVPMGNQRRGGLLTQASILTLTSNPTRTSPVKRGKWILENLLGEPPPPPPPDVPELSESQQAVRSGTLRQRMEEHRANALCASCHAAMDPIGFALENYDGIGAWRETDEGFPIDASGTLPSGEKFNGAAELKALLLRQKEQFVRCLSEKMLTYALGRGLEFYDQPALEEISRRVSAHEHRFSSLVLAITQSVPFQQQRGRQVSF